MANPNIVNVTSIKGNVAGITLTTAASNVVYNPTSSNSIYKINTLTVANGNLTTTSNVTIELLKNGSSYPITSNVIVPSSATLVVISKDSTIYIMEGDTLRAYSTSNISLSAVCSWEEIS